MLGSQEMQGMAPRFALNTAFDLDAYIEWRSCSKGDLHLYSSRFRLLSRDRLLCHSSGELERW